MEGEQRDISSPSGELPPELHAAARTLEKALAGNQNVGPAFADFCAKAYVRPEWAGPASEFIVTSFENREAELASMARIPDLIIELASGQQALTTTVAFQWAASSDSARLAKLAEALAATQSKIQSSEVVDLMLALASSLAIIKYTKAEQMLTLAEPQALEEHRESLAEARLWLAAGRMLCGCSQDTRDLYEHRLRRRRTAWTWESPVECAALKELADHLHPGREGAELFRAIVPPAWWEVANKLAAERAQVEARHEEAAHTAPVHVPTVEMTPPPSYFPPEPALPLGGNAWPFFAGGLVGAAALSLVIWVSPYELKKSLPTSADQADFVAAAPAADAPPAPQETWRKEEAARLAGANADLQDMQGRIRPSKWVDVESLLSGSTPDLPKDDERYVRLLTWLHVDPPEDLEIRTRLPSLLAAARPDSVTLELWEKLAYKGSPMEEAVRNGARRQLYENKDAWSPSQERQLTHLGWPPAP